MSESAGSYSSHHSGDDSDKEGSVACSYASESSEMMTDIVPTRKRKKQQVLGYAWVFRGIITTEKALLHTDSDQGAADDPFPKVAALLKAYWEGPCIP